MKNKVFKSIFLSVLVVVVSSIFIKLILNSIPFGALNNDHKLTIIQIVLVFIGGTWSLRLYYFANIKSLGDFLKYT